MTKVGDIKIFDIGELKVQYNICKLEYDSLIRNLDLLLNTYRGPVDSVWHIVEFLRATREFIRDSVARSGENQEFFHTIDSAYQEMNNLKDDIQRNINKRKIKITIIKYYNLLFQKEILSIKQGMPLHFKILGKEPEYKEIEIK